MTVTVYGRMGILSSGKVQSLDEAKDLVWMLARYGRTDLSAEVVDAANQFIAHYDGVWTVAQ